MADLKLLTVDDERHIHDGLDAIISWRDLGYIHIGSARNGQQAIELVRRDRPDVVLTDIKMPGMNGIELIKEIRSIPNYNPAIIVMSGYDEFEFARASLRFHVSDYLLKPIDEDELTMRLAEIRASADQASHNEGLDRVQRDAACSTVLRRLALTTPDSELLAGARRMIGEAGRFPCAFALIVPFDGPIAPAQVRKAMSLTRAKQARDWVFQEDNGPLGMLICDEALRRPSPAIDLFAKGLYRSLAELLGTPAKFVLGRPVDDLVKLKVSRDSIVRYLEANHVMNAPGYLVVPPGEPDIGRKRVGSPLDALVLAVEDDAPEAIEGLIAKTFHQIEEFGISSITLSDWILELVRRVSHLISEYDGDLLPQEDELRAISGRVELVPLSRIREAMECYLKNAADEVRRLRSMVGRAQIILVRRLVERRFSEDLTLIKAAGEVGMNAVYLGQVFRDVVGVGFKEYQRRCRIREACRLLKETDMKVADVGAAVGYSTYDYFVEQFRRETATTPSQFRHT